MRTFAIRDDITIYGEYGGYIIVKDFSKYLNGKFRYYRHTINGEHVFTECSAYSHVFPTLKSALEFSRGL